MSDFSYTLGTEYGYVFPLSSRFSLDLSVAFGYFGGKYKVYGYFLPKSAGMSPHCLVCHCIMGVLTLWARSHFSARLMSA